MSQPQKASEFEKRFAHAVAWISTHREQFWSIVGATVLVIVFLIFVIRHRTGMNEQAWNQLGVIQGLLMQNQQDQARKAFDDWKTKYGGSNAAVYGKFIQADLMYRTSDYVTAGQLYKDVAASGHPAEMRPLALSAAASSFEMAKQYPEALALARQFVDTYPEHFLAASNLLAQARLAELTGDAAAASSTYDRFVVLYPQSPWANLARGRLQMLSTGSQKPSK